MGKFFFQTEKTARYFTLGKLNEQTKQLWFVCHGYGQLAEYFIRKFEVLNDGNTFVVAPEALSRFYLEGFSGRVGASWMTKTEREIEIRDYTNYLSGLFKHLTEHKDLTGIHITVLGFSQGVATVCRWLTAHNILFDRLILWAGIFPPDLNKDFVFNIEQLQNSELFVIYGNQDPMLKPEHLEELGNFKKIKPDLNVVRFEGKHELNEGILIQIQKKTNRKIS